MKHEFKSGGVDSDRTIYVCEFPSDGAVVHATMGVERVIGSTKFASLASHHIDRVVEKRFGKRRGS
jgi:hypothetical protein